MGGGTSVPLGIAAPVMGAEGLRERVPLRWSARAGAHRETPAASGHPSVLAALGKQLRSTVMQNVSRSPTQPSRTTCGAPSGSRGKSYATCISSPRSMAVSLPGGNREGGSCARRGHSVFAAIQNYSVHSKVELLAMSHRRSCDEE